MNMKKTTSNYFRGLALAAISLGMAGATHGSLIEIKFATGPIALVTSSATPDAVASRAAFLAALSNNSLNPANFGGVSGVLFYESTTGGDGNSPTQTFNGAVDSLSFTVANWFSQSLTGIGNNGDIVVENDGTAQLDNDRIQVTVNCTPTLNNTTQTTCSAQTYNFNYAITDSNTNVTWALDQFILLLEESNTNNPLSGTSLPTRAEWESPQWTTKRVDLRFNPSCAPVANQQDPCANVTERATLTLLAVPEPGTLALLGLGLLALAGLQRRALISR